MTTARDLLERFRPAGTPGAAAPAGVPADRREDLRRELQPVLDLLEPTEAQCSAVTAQAQEVARRLRADAATRADAVLAGARSRAEASRAEAAGRQRRRSDEQAAAELALAAREATDLASRARDRADSLAAQVVAAVRDELLTGVQDASVGAGRDGTSRDRPP